MYAKREIVVIILILFQYHNEINIKLILNDQSILLLKLANILP